MGQNHQLMCFGNQSANILFWSHVPNQGNLELGTVLGLWLPVKGSAYMCKGRPPHIPSPSSGGKIKNPPSSHPHSRSTAILKAYMITSRPDAKPQPLEILLSGDVRSLASLLPP